MKTVQKYLAVDTFHLSVEDNGQWISIMALDPFKDEENCCASYSELSYVQALALAAWLTKRAEVGRRREARYDAKEAVTSPGNLLQSV